MLICEEEAEAFMSVFELCFLFSDLGKMVALLHRGLEDNRWATIKEQLASNHAPDPHRLPLDQHKRLLQDNLLSLETMAANHEYRLIAGGKGEPAKEQIGSVGGGGNVELALKI